MIFHNIYIYNTVKMIHKPIFLLLLITLLTLANSALVIDLAGRFSNYTCLKSSNYSQTIIRAYHSYGAIDLDAKLNIYQSNLAGLATDVYMFPCRGKDPALQVKELIDYLDGMVDESSAFAYRTGTIWLDIETNPSSGCSWSQGTSQSNCQFLSTLVQSLQSSSRSVGIYASHYMWLQIFSSSSSCSQFTTLPLWYAHYDGQKNFNDWQANKFGGWTSPTIKQYVGDAAVCGYKVDVSYY